MDETERREKMKEYTEKSLLIMKKLCSMNIRHGDTGKTECPGCHGKEALRYYRSDYNGHIHANCETCGIRIMQ